MTFSRVKPAGWVDDEILTHTQANGLDTDHADAVDGASGGSYSPSTYIDFPGAFGPRWGTSRYPLLVARDEWRDQSPVIFDEKIATGGGTASTIVDGLRTFGAVGTTTPSALYYRVDNFPDSSTLVGIKARLLGAGGHGALPATMPVVAVYRNNADGTITYVDGATDGSATVGAYEAAHEVEKTFVGEGALIGGTGKSYMICVYNEQSTNALAGLAVVSVHAQFACSQVRP